MAGVFVAPVCFAVAFALAAVGAALCPSCAAAFFAVARAAGRGAAVEAAAPCDAGVE